MPTNNTIGITKYSSQYIDNLSFDEDYKVSVTEVVTENVAGTALVRQKPIATEETLQALQGFQIPAHDEIEINYTDATKTVVTAIVYKLAAVTVATKTFDLSGATKDIISI